MKNVHARLISLSLLMVALGLMASAGADPAVILFLVCLVAYVVEYVRSIAKE